MKYDISVVGDCVHDTFILADSKLISNRKKRGEKYLSYIYGDKLGVRKLESDLGGSACNAAVTMRLLGIKTNIVSMVGDDMYGREAIERLKNKRVGTSFLYKEYGKNTGLSFILLGPDGDRTILTYRVNNDFGDVQLRKLYKASRSYYIAGINRYSRILVNPVLANAIRYNKKIYINPSAYQIEHDLPILKSILKHVEVAVMNLEEAKDILRINSNIKIKELLKRISDLGSKVVVITDGSNGAYSYDGEEFLYSGIYKIKRVDATGAGDSFAGTFVTMHRKGYDIPNCMKFAMVNSASVVSVYGAQKGLLGRREIIKRYKQGKVRVKKI